MAIEKLIKLIAVKNPNETWECKNAYKFTDEQLKNMEYDHLTLSEFYDFECYGGENGYYELVEGLFYFDFDKLEFNIIKLFLEDQEKEKFIKEDYKQFIDTWERIYYDSIEDGAFEQVEEFKTYEKYFE